MREVSGSPGQCWGVGEGPLRFNFKTNFPWWLHLETWEGCMNSVVLKNLPIKYAAVGFIMLIFEKVSIP